MSEEQVRQDFINARVALRDAIRAHGLATQEVFEDLASAYEAQAAHRVNYNNPHGDTKETVGLGLLENRAPATVQDIELAINKDRYLNPHTYKLLIARVQQELGGAISFVRTPTAISPTEDEVAVDYSQTSTLFYLELVGDDYRHAYQIYENDETRFIARAYREFEVAAVGESFSQAILSERVEGDMLETQVYIPPGNYQWRCRDMSIDGEYSPWSIPATFTVVSHGYALPVVSVTSNGLPDNAVYDGPVFTLSVTVPGGKTHVSTSWYVRDNANQLVWSSEHNTVNKTSIRMPQTILSAGQTYKVRGVVNLNDTRIGSLDVGFTVSQVSPVNPGPLTLAKGNSTLGFYGQIEDEELITGTELLAHVPFANLLTGTQETPWTHQGNKWFKVSVNGNVWYVARYPILYGITNSNVNFIHTEPTFLIRGQSFKLSMLQSGNGEWFDILSKFTDITAVNDRWMNLNPELLGFNYTRAKDVCRDFYSGTQHWARGDGKKGTATDTLTALPSGVPTSSSTRHLYFFRPVLKVNH